MEFSKGLRISTVFSEIISLYKIEEFHHHENILRETLIIKLSEHSKKYYIYKMVLLSVHIE